MSDADGGRDEREYDVLFKILLVGDANVGKTSLLSRFIGEGFVESYKATIGVDFRIKTLEIDQRRVKLQIWDTAGQERFAPLVSSYFRGGHGVAIVYDIANRQSFERVNHWANLMRDHANEAVEMMILGNKSDLDSREVSVLEGEELARKYEALWWETSAMSSENVETAFATLAQKILQTRRLTYGPAPIQVYGPPVLTGTPLTQRSCCHLLGPPGNAYHEGSHVDRETIMQRSLELQELPSIHASAVGVADALALAVYAGHPLVVRGMKDDWMSLLAPKSLARLFGDREIPVAQLKGSRSEPPFRSRQMTLTTFFETGLETAEVYLQQLPVMEHLPELAELGLPINGPDLLQEALGASALVTCTLFYGAAGIQTSLHFDRGDFATDGDEVKSSIDNFFLQVAGRKRFRLYRPCDHDRLYPRGGSTDPDSRDRIRAPHVSQIHDTDADSSEFPFFEEAKMRRLEVTLEANDALLLPRWWWHETYALSDGYAVNWWFETRDLLFFAVEFFRWPFQVFSLGKNFWRNTLRTYKLIINTESKY